MTQWIYANCLMLNSNPVEPAMYTRQIEDDHNRLRFAMWKGEPIIERSDVLAEGLPTAPPLKEAD